MNASSLLPSGFEPLEPYVSRWAVAGSANRDRRRTESTAEERADFYAAVKDRAAEALAYLDSKPIARFEEREQRLMDLMLSFAHVALAVELQGPDESQHAKLRAHMRIVQTPADKH